MTMWVIAGLTTMAPSSVVIGADQDRLLVHRLPIDDTGLGR